MLALRYRAYEYDPTESPGYNYICAFELTLFRFELQNWKHEINYDGVKYLDDKYSKGNK